jgi:hypothetical protein
VNPETRSKERVSAKIYLSLVRNKSKTISVDVTYREEVVYFAMPQLRWSP